MEGERAIIDIGSNTVRLVIFGGPARAPTILHNEKVTAKLGRGVAEDGMLSQKSMDAALRALRRYAVLLRLRRIGSVTTVATAAVRDAGNGPEFLAAVAATGLSPRLLTGEEEAMTSAQGVIGAFPVARGVVADLGGGSLELIHVQEGGSKRGASLPFGSLRLAGLRSGGADKFARRIRKALDVAEWHCAAGESLFLVGGPHRAIARYAMARLDWPLDDPHGFAMSPEAVFKLSRSIQHGNVQGAADVLSASRLSTLPDTIALLAVLVREIRPASIVFSSWGLREGVLFSRLGKRVRAGDPLIAGVSAFAATLGCSMADAEMAAAWTKPAAASAPHCEPLRLAAIMLALASQTIEPNLRADAAIDWALRKRWIGIDAAGRAMLAACVAANSGRDTPEVLSRLTSEGDLREATRWGLAIRLCRRLTGLVPAVLSHSRLTAGPARLELAMRASHAALYADASEKDLRQLALALGLQPHFRTVETW